jgi:MiaB-like tRNA modifying enzyme
MEFPSSYSIRTFGCTHNQSDSLKIEQILISKGLKQVEIENADLIIINTCAVKQATDSKIFEIINQISYKYSSKLIAITGCLPFISHNNLHKIILALRNKGFIIHPNGINLFFEQLLQFCNGEYKNQENISTFCYDKSLLNPKIEDNNKIGIVQISEGCNNNCSYCCTKNARGKLISFNHTSIIEQIRFLLNNGIKEIHLTSQDLGNYNFNGMKLHDLLKSVLQIDEEFYIRLGMLNPEYVIKNVKEFVELFNDKRLFRFLHIPIQSASNNILQKMNRHYKIERVKEIIDSFNQFDSNFSFSTDIIVGFPTETEEDHKISLSFIKKWKPRNLNISKFSPRPHTKAKQLPQLRSETIKKRSLDFTQLFKEYSTLLDKKWIDWIGEVFFDEYRKSAEYPYMGRNLYYIPILSKEGEIGVKKRVRITQKKNFSFITD